MARRIIALSNQKGGVGKTSSAVNLAAAFGEIGERVLIVDLDPQGSASLWLGANDDGVDLLGLLERPAPIDGFIIDTGVPGVELLPGGLGLAAADVRLMGKVGQHTRLTRCFQKSQRDWDWILLDCPPTLGLLSINALAAALGVVVPVEASSLSLAGLSDLTDVVADVSEELNPGLEILGILVCRTNPQTNIYRETRELLEQAFPGKVAPNPIRDGVVMAEAPGYQQSVLQHAPESNPAMDYRAAAAWLKEVVANG